VDTKAEVVAAQGMDAWMSWSNDGTPHFADPEERVLGTFPDVSLVMDREAPTPGVVHVTTRRFLHQGKQGAVSPSPSGRGAPLHRVTLHAVKMGEEGGREGEGAEKKGDRAGSLYVLVAPLNDVTGRTDVEAPEVELRLVPGASNDDPAATLQALFKAFCDGAADCPDPEASGDEAEEDGVTVWASAADRLGEMVANNAADPSFADAMEDRCGD